MYIASFDIGKKNFAFCVEKINTESLQHIKKIPIRKRYNKDGTATKEFQDVLSKFYNCGQVVLIAVLDLTQDCNSKLYLDPHTFINMTNTLDKYQKYWDKCSAFIIEKQMSFRNKYNTMALKLGQHCYSYFIIKYQNTKQIIEYPAYHKTQILGAKKIDVKQKPKRKKWAIVKALDILNQRKDTHTIKGFESCKKKDDMADCLLMTITFAFQKWIDKKF